MGMHAHCQGCLAYVPEWDYEDNYDWCSAAALSRSRTSLDHCFFRWCHMRLSTNSDTNLLFDPCVRTSDVKKYHFMLLYNLYYLFLFAFTNYWIFDSNCPRTHIGSYGRFNNAEWHSLAFWLPEHFLYVLWFLICWFAKWCNIKEVQYFARMYFSTTTFLNTTWGALGVK